MQWQPLFKNDYSFTIPFNIFEFIKNQVKDRNESFDIFIGGDRGFGKSSCAMSLALLLDDNFSIDRWCFKTEKYLELLTSNLSKGTVIVLDDIGTQESGSSRKWQAAEAHDLADITQVNRTDGLITIGTSLELNRGEKRLRAGFRILISPVRKIANSETHNGMAIDVEMRLRHADIFNDDIRYKLWRYDTGGRIKLVRLYHPPTFLWNEYQIIRSEFLTSIKKQDKKDNTNTKWFIDKQYASYLSIMPKTISKYRRVLKVFTVKKAYNKKTGITMDRFKQEIQDLFNYAAGGSVLNVIRNLVSAEIIEEGKYDKDNTIVWLSDIGLRFVNKEPLQLPEATDTNTNPENT